VLTNRKNGPFFNNTTVGHPNVGKSRFFNSLSHKRISIVHDVAGVTCDIITHEIRDGIVMDPGGYGLSGSTIIKEIKNNVDDQVCLAIESADLIFFVVDARDGVMPMDYDIDEMLLKSSKDIIVIANKIDDEGNEQFADVFKIF
jgi:GTP-binding protein